MPLPFEPHRFSSAVPYYVRGRLSYPEALIARVAEVAGLGPEHRVLDLGCGPGFLAAAFAPRVREVVALDPDPSMLEAAKAYCAEWSERIALVQGSSYDLGPKFGEFRLATMGRSFHWMDREATLKALEGLLDARGAVALLDDKHLEVPENRWERRIEEIQQPFARKDPSYLARKDPNANWIGHEVFLLDSAFGRLERVSVIRRLRTPVETFVDRTLSKSATTPEKLGADLPAFVEKLRRMLDEEAKDGLITEIVEFQALLGLRQN